MIPMSIRDAMLRNGDHLSSAEFLERWEQLPDLTHAELINGKVCLMASPVSAHHSQPHARLMAWLGYYVALTPGIEIHDNVTYLLDEANTVQPDALLMFPARGGGAVRQTASGYLTGPAEFVAEVAYSSRNIDLHDKRDAYRNAGVREYLVWRTLDGAVDWWLNGPDGFQPIESDANGLRHSRLLPGLCLNDTMLTHGDLRGLFEQVQQACDQAADHAALVRRLSSPA